MRIKVIRVTDSSVIFDRTWQEISYQFICDRDAFPLDTLPEDDFYFIEHGIFDHYRNDTMIGGLCLRWGKIKESVKRL